MGLLQTAPSFGAIEANLHGIRELRLGLGAVDIAVTPELAVNGYGFRPARAAEMFESDDPRLVALAAEGIGLGFTEKSDGGIPWNTYLLTDPLTGVASLQRKLHPVSYAPWNEHLSFQRGTHLELAQVCGVNISTVICNDMWHPAIPWLAAHCGAEVLIVPVASIYGSDPEGTQRRWHAILEHAALLLQCYVVFVNRCGTDSSVQFWGGSRIIGPDGNVLTSLGDVPDCAAVDLDLDVVHKIRSEVPLLAESRTDFLTNYMNRPEVAARV